MNKGGGPETRTTREVDLVKKVENFDKEDELVKKVEIFGN